MRAHYALTKEGLIPFEWTSDYCDEHTQLPTSPGYEVMTIAEYARQESMRTVH
jgi:hypothetical protein